MGYGGDQLLDCLYWERSYSREMNSRAMDFSARAHRDYTVVHSGGENRGFNLLEPSRSLSFTEGYYFLSIPAPTLPRTRSCRLRRRNRGSSVSGMRWLPGGRWIPYWLPPRKQGPRLRKNRTTGPGESTRATSATRTVTCGRSYGTQHLGTYNALEVIKPLPLHYPRLISGLNIHVETTAFS
jgi:hypothetical protein